jgi:hypothetical protein
MPLALLVLAFRQPEVLRSAIPVYRAAGFHIFVHLDSKADINNYTARLGEAASDCHFIGRRYDIYWGGFSMIDAELALIFNALEKGEYDRFILISDDTFPLLAPARLNHFCQEDYDRIMIRELQNEEPFMQRYSKFYFFDHQASSLLGRPIESATIDEEFIEQIKRLEKAKVRGKRPINVFYGSQWWSITKDSMLTILKRLEEDLHLFESFRYSAVPDELLFQTLIGNYVPRSRVRSGPVFVDWNRNPKPYIFTRAAELSMVSSDYAFARKFSGQTHEAYEGILERLK